MPQELNVLKCFSCNTFQVHILKKSKKWQCKVCNEKQSIRKVYGQGSGKDCRIHVQKLNTIRLQQQQDSAVGVLMESSDWSAEEGPEPTFQSPQSRRENPSPVMIKQTSSYCPREVGSKWEQFLDPPHSLAVRDGSGDSDSDLTSVRCNQSSTKKRLGRGRKGTSPSSKTRKKQQECLSFDSEDNYFNCDELLDSEERSSGTLDRFPAQSSNCPGNLLPVDLGPSRRSVDDVSRVSCRPSSKWANFLDNDQGSEDDSSSNDLHDITDENPNIPLNKSMNGLYTLPNAKEKCNSKCLDHKTNIKSKAFNVKSSNVVEEIKRPMIERKFRTTEFLQTQSKVKTSLFSHDDLSNDDDLDEVLKF